MLKLLLVLPPLLVAALVAACGGAAATPVPTRAAPASAVTATPAIGKDTQGRSVIRIYLSEPTGTYQTGEATLTDLGGTTEVKVEVSPSMAGAQPMHVHAGSCREIGTITDQLQNVVSGTSITIIDKPLAQVATGNTVINVHLSFADIRTYTACGVIPALNAS